MFFFPIEPVLPNYFSFRQHGPYSHTSKLKHRARPLKIWRNHPVALGVIPPLAAFSLLSLLSLSENPEFHQLIWDLLWLWRTFFWNKANDLKNLLNYFFFFPSPSLNNYRLLKFLKSKALVARLLFHIQTNNTFQGKKRNKKHLQVPQQLSEISLQNNSPRMEDTSTLSTLMPTISVLLYLRDT